MKRVLSMFLLLGALLGLFGEGMARAAGPVSPAAATVAAEPDCMKTMHEDPGGEPCKGITLDCIAAMGCVVPFMLANSQVDLIAPALSTGIQPVAVIARLSGRIPSLETEPPNLLI